MINIVLFSIASFFELKIKIKTAYIMIEAKSYIRGKKNKSLVWNVAENKHSIITQCSQWTPDEIWDFA